MHGADRDIIWLQRDFGIYICNLFDMGQVLATSTKKSDDNGSLESEKTHNNDSFGEDDEGMIVNSKKVEGSEFISSCLHKVDKGDQLPRYRARVFAAKVILIFLSGPSFLYPSPVEPVSRERESRVRTSCLIGRKGQRDEGQVVFLLAGRDKLLPFVFRCLSRLPNAVGKEQTHFDILQARKGKMIHGVQTLGDWYSGATRKTTKCRMGERLQMIEGIT
ncbi:uncharacterized protein LOC131065703 isoform X2 [Cryptomeria japonica]|nr:uncharacterized protein LOC131065703 isoform X2 [Cryptomeria japonica]XP_059065253.1 uncharacterized protein LOC131065703 isoform X2 [Cryptomeria japonica]